MSGSNLSCLRTTYNLPFLGTTCHVPTASWALTSALGSYCVLLKDTIQRQWGLNPGPLDSESEDLPLSHCALMSGTEDIKLFICSNQLSIKLLINDKIAQIN